MKPSEMWHSENSRAYTHISKHTLPVGYRMDRKSWLTWVLFKDALLSCYAQQMENYCLGNI